MTQHTLAGGRLGALAVHDEVAYDAVQPLSVALLAHLGWKLEQNSHRRTVIAGCELQQWPARLCLHVRGLSLIHISEPTRLGMISYAVFCLKKKKQKNKHIQHNDK